MVLMTHRSSLEGIQLQTQFGLKNISDHYSQSLHGAEAHIEIKAKPSILPQHSHRDLHGCGSI
jgi:hypothetical protein